GARVVDDRPRKVFDVLRRLVRGAQPEGRRGGARRRTVGCINEARSGKDVW
ncbi:MAG: hypothetical protein QOF30_193, partial [Acidimicrobiaceae bacterium]|nr:hypothetical protein [Acidimicrobiaceae bacterium]